MLYTYKKKRGFVWTPFLLIIKTHTLAQAMPDSQTDLVTKAQLGLQAPENQVFEPQKLVEMFFFWGGCFLGSMGLVYFYPTFGI